MVDSNLLSDIRVVISLGGPATKYQDTLFWREQIRNLAHFINKRSYFKVLPLNHKEVNPTDRLMMINNCNEFSIEEFKICP